MTQQISFETYRGEHPRTTSATSSPPSEPRWRPTCRSRRASPGRTSPGRRLRDRRRHSARRRPRWSGRDGPRRRRQSRHARSCAHTAPARRSNGTRRTAELAPAPRRSGSTSFSANSDSSSSATSRWHYVRCGACLSLRRTRPDQRLRAGAAPVHRPRGGIGTPHLGPEVAEFVRTVFSLDEADELCDLLSDVGFNTASPRRRP